MEAKVRQQVDFSPESKSCGSYSEFLAKYGDKIKQTTGKDLPPRSPFRDNLSGAVKFAASLAGERLLQEAEKQKPAKA